MESSAAAPAGADPAPPPPGVVDASAEAGESKAVRQLRVELAQKQEELLALQVSVSHQHRLGR